MKKPTILPRKPRQRTPIKIEEIELEPHSWPKFEKLIRSAAKMGPKPHKTKGT